jgi:anaerobic selenocysteine-containing dehydrogenase
MCRQFFRSRRKEKDLFMQEQRRDFLKITAAGAAGLALARAKRAFAAWPSTGTLAVNPTISNMRVVGCVDTKMM